MLAPPITPYNALMIYMDISLRRFRTHDRGIEMPLLYTITLMHHCTGIYMIYVYVYMYNTTAGI